MPVFSSFAKAAEDSVLECGGPSRRFAKHPE
jgi:hypothetical protein